MLFSCPSPTGTRAGLCLWGSEGLSRCGFQDPSTQSSMRSSQQRGPAETGQLENQATAMGSMGQEGVLNRCEQLSGWVNRIPTSFLFHGWKTHRPFLQEGREEGGSPQHWGQLPKLGTACPREPLLPMAHTICFHCCWEPLVLTRVIPEASKCHVNIF